MTRYRFTPSQIREMTPYQQMVFFNALSKEDKVLHFETEEEFLQWQLTTRRSR